MHAEKAGPCQKAPQHSSSEECQMICIPNQDMRLPFKISYAALSSEVRVRGLVKKIKNKKIINACLNCKTSPRGHDDKSKISRFAYI